MQLALQNAWVCTQGSYILGLYYFHNNHKVIYCPLIMSPQALSMYVPSIFKFKVIVTMTAQWLMKYNLVPNVLCLPTRDFQCMSCIGFRNPMVFFLYPLLHNWCFMFEWVVTVYLLMFSYNSFCGGFSQSFLLMNVTLVIQ